jgi:hypothetical protein
VSKNITKLGFLIVGDMDSNGNSIGTQTIRDDYHVAIDNQGNLIVVESGKKKKNYVKDSVDIEGTI